MNKPPETRSPAHSAPDESLDPWNEFLSESSDDRGGVRDSSDEFGSELDVEGRSHAVRDGFATLPSAAHQELALPGYSDSTSESASLVHLVAQAVSRRTTLSHSEIAQSISLADVVSRQVPVHWAEAVATVQALCASLLAEGSAGAPEMSEVLITPTGLVLVRDDARSERDVRNAGLVLHALLSTSAPPLPLRLFVTASMSSQRYSSIELYAEALSLYAAPDADGADLVRTLYRRSFDYAPPALSQVDGQQVRGTPRSSSRWMVPLATAAAAAVVTAGALLTLLGQSPWQVNAQPKALIEPAATAVEANVTTVPVPAPAPRDTWKPGPVSTSTRQEREDTPSFLPSHSPVQVRVLPPASSGGEGLSPGAPGRPASQTAPELRLAPQDLPRALPLQTPGPSQKDPTTYSSADADVQPPQMESPSMVPTLPGPSVDGASLTLELTIDERGVVQSIKPLTPTTRLIDSMILSPLKNMKFRPAQRHGAAVKYRLQLTVNSSQS